MEKKVLLFVIGFSVGALSVILLFNFNLFVVEKTINVVEIANLLIVIALTLAIPIFISPQTEASKKSQEILVGEINQFIEVIENLRDWLCELPNEAITEETHKQILFNFKKIRQHLVMLEKEVERTKKDQTYIHKVKDQYQSFWMSGTEELSIGRQVTPSYKLITLESATNFEMSLKELRYEVRG